ncbi:hypothetical protein [Simkania sp.]|uniref:hypothetical protein n=1 Tax=Simkania sp. TaxID=34094 RepID=UPI003B5233BB
MLKTCAFLAILLTLTFLSGCKGYNITLSRDASPPILKEAADTRELINQETATLLEE